MECKIPNGIDMTQQASWCPGCGHGIIVRLLAEAAEALGIEDRMLTVADRPIVSGLKAPFIALFAMKTS